jgi:hypothetical protein
MIKAKAIQNCHGQGSFKNTKATPEIDRYPEHPTPDRKLPDGST